MTKYISLCCLNICYDHFIMTSPILMISYEAPPRLSAESILVGKTLKALADASEQPPIIDLVCASAGDEVPTDKKLEELLPESTCIHRLDPVPLGRKTILQRIIGGKGGWQKAATSKGAALFPAEHKKPSLLYSRSHPPASHLAVLELLEGPLRGVPWIAHFSDPWSKHAYYSTVTRAALGRYERQVFAAATLLVFVSEALRDAVLAKESLDIKAKARVIPHLFDASLYGKAELPAALRNANAKTLSVAHVGDLYGLRTPEYLFDGMGRAMQHHPQLREMLKLWLVGRMDPVFKGLDQRAGVADQIQYLQPVPYLESLAVMASADVLLAVEAPIKNSVFFPSKLIDYLGAGKRIFAITPKGGETARLMHNWNQIWCDVTDINAIAAVFKRIADGDLWSAPDPGVLEVYKAETVGKQLAGMFLEAMAQQPTL